MNGRKLLLMFCSVLLLAAMVTPPAAGQDKSKAEVNKEAPKAPTPRVSEAEFIRELAINGRETKDAYLLIQAAQLGITSSKIPSLKPEVKSAGQAPEKKLNVEPAALLKEAAQMAGEAGDRQAIQIAAEIARNKVTGLGNDALGDEISKTTVSRGFAAGGSLKGSGCLNSGQIVYWNVPFRGGERASVSVSATYPLDLVVTDAYGNALGDVGYSRSKYASWLVTSGGKIYVALAASYGDTCYSIYIP